VETREGTRYVWTTFSADQVDLNWQSPDLMFEFLDILFLYLSMGAKIFRLDAIAFLWKQIGTTCLHLPETHEVVKVFRDVLEMVAPETILLTETNVPHEENISYFGKGDEAHMVYQFSLPPLLLHGLLNQSSKQLTQWASELPKLPKGCTFLNFTASHDGIGVRPLQGILNDKELKKLIKMVESRGGKVSYKSNSDGSKSPYELNITYYEAMSDPEDAKLGMARFLCSQAVALSLQGIPAVYFHSLVGTLNNQEGVKETKQNRTINRKKWELAELKTLINDPETHHAKVFDTYQKLLRRRSNQIAFDPDASQTIETIDKNFFALTRTSLDKNQKIVCLYNFTAEKQILQKPDFISDSKEFYDIASGKKIRYSSKGLSFSPYQFYWLVVK
jgi:sucrose phosphorylase